MANGEKILNALPNATARIIENESFRYIEVEQNDEWIADFNIEWWHSEYKEPKTGHWIEISRGFECDQCHGIDTDGLEPPYCKWCGTQMKGANE